VNPGDIVTGVVKEIKDYGATIKLGDKADALLHIVDMSWRRVRHPDEILVIGQPLTVVILKEGRSNDGQRHWYSAGLKQLTVDPWTVIHERCPVGQPTAGEITHLADYGLFVRICPSGVEGLVHVSTMSNRVKSYAVGQSVEVVPVEYVQDSRRIELVLEKDYKHE
jgi:small subunit ribosomal protein S1